MNTYLRSLIVWLLLLALPCQGMAAAVMRVCAPGQAVPAQPMATTMHAMDQIDDGQLPPCHKAALKADSGEHPHEPAHGGTAKCASCAACGIFAAALPTAFPALAAAAPCGTSGAFADSYLPSVHLAQPERPPRPSLA